MYMYPLNPGVVFNFEVTGPIDPSTRWTFAEFYAPADRQGPLKDRIRKALALSMVNRAISNGSINKAGTWEATVIRNKTTLRVRVKHVGTNVHLI